MILQPTTIKEFEIMFKEHYETLCNVAYKITKNREQAEDIVQEVFIKIWENKDSIDIKISVFSYLYRSVINSCYNDVKRKKIININHSTDDELEKIGFLDTTDDKIDFKQLQNQINLGLDKLPPKCKTIFILSRFENYKYREIAEMLNISIKTVETQMGIAISRLNKDLKPILAKHYPELLIITIILSIILNLL